MKIKMGEIWRVDLTADAKDAEINKPRPCAVVNDDEVAEKYVAVLNNDAIGVLPLKIVVPLTRWQERYEIAPWHIPIDISPSNGLRIKSTADTFQVRSISESRFIEKIGELTEDDLEKIRHGLAICLCIDY
jgi:mRNA interferase MazF